ncbi:MAG: hypothetical protein ABII23_07825 [bacterium]
MNPIKHILFVCTGNACRSVLAEYYFHKQSSELGIIDAVASSAGISASPFFKVPGVVIRLLQREGIRFMDHKPISLTQDHMDEADLVCCMETHHLQTLLTRFPTSEKKIVQLYEYAFGRKKDIVDPIGQNDLIFEFCFKDIKNCINEILINRLNK